MNENQITIFHISRRDGTPIFLHPLNKNGSLIDMIEMSEITGLYGKEPRVESLTILKNEFYRLVEQAVRDWSAEKRFIPRFIISSVVFLAIYFLFSFMIRDPIPMVDEIVAGLVSAIICYIILARRDYGSRIPTEMKIRLRKKVDEIMFHKDDFTNEIEEYFQSCELSGSTQELWDRMINDSFNYDLNIIDENRRLNFLASIKYLFNEGELKKNERIFNRLVGNDSNNKRLRNRMIRWMSRRKVDPFIFALYIKVAQKKRQNLQN